MKKTRLTCLVALIAGCGAADGAPPDNGVHIIRGADDGTPRIDLTIAGEGLDLPTGTTAIIQIGTPSHEGERLGHAVVDVDAGAFSVTFPKVCESGSYKQKTVLFDLDDDGICDDGEPVLTDTDAVDGGPTVVVRAPSDGAWGDFLVGTCADFVADWPTE